MGSYVFPLVLLLVVMVSAYFFAVHITHRTHANWHVRYHHKCGFHTKYGYLETDPCASCGAHYRPDEWKSIRMRARGLFTWETHPEDRAAIEAEDRSNG